MGQRIAKAARQSGLHADGNNIVINDGKAAFQSVFHIHLHVRRGRPATSCRSPRACCCAATPTGKQPAGSCGMRWPNSTPPRRTD